MADETRRAQRALSGEEAGQMEQIKVMGQDFIAFLHGLGGTDPEGDRQGSRDLALAQTAIEDAVMRANRHITG